MVARSLRMWKAPGSNPGISRYLVFLKRKFVSCCWKHWILNLPTISKKDSKEVHENEDKLTNKYEDVILSCTNKLWHSNFVWSHIEFEWIFIVRRNVNRHHLSFTSSFNLLSFVLLLMIEAANITDLTFKLSCLFNYQCHDLQSSRRWDVMIKFNA